MVTAQLVKELREKTGAGMMDCKKALSEVHGNLDEAVAWLRKKGLNASAKKASRIATDGLVTTFVPAGKAGVILELNSETDFVAKNSEFKSFAEHLVRLIAEKKPSSVEALGRLPYSESASVDDQLNLLVSKIGEKITIRRFDAVEVNEGKIGEYVHLGSKIGVLVGVTGNSPDDVLIKDIAMHVAAASPRYLSESDIPQDVIEKEKEIYREQLKKSGKPDDMVEKILAGKLKKFASEICLNDQIFIKDPAGKKTVREILKSRSASNKILFFRRYQVGEGMEKREVDFAGEVAAMV